MTATKSGKLIVMERKKNVINIRFKSFNYVLLSTILGIPITSPITTMVGSLILVISLAGIVFCMHDGFVRHPFVLFKHRLWVDMIRNACFREAPPHL